MRIVAYKKYLVCCLCLFFPVIALTFPNQQSDCEIDQSQPAEIVTSDLSLRPLWAKKVNLVSETTNSIVINSDSITITQTCGAMDSFNLSTGVLRWHIPTLNNPKNLVFDSNRQSIYVSEISGLRAISISSGDTIWVNNSPLFSHTANPAYLLTSGDLVVDAVGRGMYYVDPVTGNVGNKIDVPAGSVFYTEHTTLVKSPLTIQEFDNSTEHILWSQDKLTGSWEMIPFESSHIILVRQRYHEISPSLVALDWDTGEVRWEQPDKMLTSNIANLGENLFALDDKNQLLVLDVNSGRQMSLTSFRFQSETILPVESVSMEGNQIAIQGNTIAVYFKASHLLSLYQLD